MYHYPSYLETDLQRLIPVMKAYPLGLIVTSDGTQFGATHIPLMIEPAADGGVRLLGHMDAANPQLAELDNRPVYVVFFGPDTYISPSVYVTRQLPTWNYVTIHAEGRSRVEAPGVGIFDDIARLAEQSEPPAGWTFDKSEPAITRLAPLIRRVIIDVTRIEGRFKLSQEKSAADQQAAANHLIAQSAPERRALLDDLCRRRTNNDPG
ncbi:FMN-binding negative transcriptional regulator [Bradyrhizobium prioriisuperbiae]|uniref:FMN-binding negative transcriptional regulator n=1 Tax=Bradyrhizobium prioriisuperbiae TaxID=2854389 RepID=UPI0028E816AF|nr:FMN-binding negative transcriptional regulator [Bradyrhizobium prioritasuperba]